MAHTQQEHTLASICAPAPSAPLLFLRLPHVSSHFALSPKPLQMDLLHMCGHVSGARGQQKHAPLVSVCLFWSPSPPPHISVPPALFHSPSPDGPPTCVRPCQWRSWATAGMEFQHMLHQQHGRIAESCLSEHLAIQEEPCHTTLCLLAIFFPSLPPSLSPSVPPCLPLALLPSLFPSLPPSFPPSLPLSLPPYLLSLVPHKPTSLLHLILSPPLSPPQPTCVMGNVGTN
ncbi:unnamed protein product [Closterium sp. Naga37s-1]|nr:unnamed protein product [Closterium sp. Naga37s-1]